MKLWMAPRSKDSSSSSARSIRASTIGSSPSTSGWSLERPISAPHAAAVQYSNGTSATGRAAAARRGSARRPPARGAQKNKGRPRGGGGGAPPPGRGARRALKWGFLKGSPAKAVIARPPVHAPRAIFQAQGPGQVVVLGFLGLLLQERVCVLGKAARGCEQQPFVLGAFGEQALDQLETERSGGADQLGIVVGGEP